VDNTECTKEVERPHNIDSLEKAEVKSIQKRLSKIDELPALLGSTLSICQDLQSQIYHIVDECDAVLTRMFPVADTDKKALGVKEYEDVVSGMESMFTNWDNVVKQGL
jgi:hypothetical protein